jgi:hypothetical protein
MSDQPSHRPSSRRCPQCSQPVKRVLRTAGDKRLLDADSYRRYRCRSDHCGWQGLLPASRRRRRPRAGLSPVQVAVRMGRMGLWGLLAAGVAWGSWSALQAMMAG